MTVGCVKLTSRLNKAFTNVFSQISTPVRPVQSCIKQQPEENYLWVRTDQVPSLMCYNHPLHDLFFLHCSSNPIGFWLICHMPSRFHWLLSSHFAASTFFIRPGLQFPFKLPRVSSSYYAASCLLFLQGKTLTCRAPRIPLMCISLEQQEPGRQTFHWHLSIHLIPETPGLQEFQGILGAS